MRKIFSLGIACLLAGCTEEVKLATEVSACRVRLTPTYSEWDETNAWAPQVVSTFSLSGLRGAQSTYHLFWLQREGLFRELRYETGVRRQPQTLLVPNVSAFHAINHQEQTLVAYAQRVEGKDALFVSFGNATASFSQKLQTSEDHPIKSIAIAAQGLTAVILYTAQTKEGLKAYAQTIDLCPFYDDDEIQQRCYTPIKEKIPSQAIDAENTETHELLWRVPEKSTPVFVGKANVLSHGAISITSTDENEFFASIEEAPGQKKLYLLSRRDERLTFQAEEAPLLPDPRYPLPGQMPLVSLRASGAAYAFYTQDTAQLSLSLLDGKYQRLQAPLLGEGSLQSYAAALAYRVSAPDDSLAALWFGPGPFNKGHKQLSFARLNLSGKLREAPLLVLPGEEMSASSMAVIDHENTLQFGVFYQHENSDVGLGFVQIDCGP